MGKRTFEKEADVKRAVKQLLKDRGWFFWMPAANGFGASGVADICALKTGVFMAVETKFGANKPSAMQKQYLKKVNAQNGFAFVVNERNLDDLETFLDHFTSAAMMVQRGERPDAEEGALMRNAMGALMALTGLLDPA